MADRRPKVFDEATIREAAGLLLKAAPGSKVILFGSYARGEPRSHSDLDFLVIEPHVTSPWEEMVRLRDVLRPLRVAVDVLVTDEPTFRHWCNTPGHVYCQAATEGRQFDAVA